MKILHISKYYSPYNGGIENVVFNLVEGSRSIDHQVDVLCFNDSNKNLTEVFVKHKIIRAKRLFTLYSLPISFSYIKKLIELVNQYDIIHIHTPNPLAILGVFLVNIKAKMIIHWHSDIIEQTYLYAFLRKIHKKVLSKTDKIILTTNNYLESSTQLFNFQYKCEVIPIGIPDHEANTLSLKKKIVNANDEIIVFAIGRLVTYKGFEKLIESAQFLNKNIKIIIAGDGPLKANLIKLVKDLNVCDTVNLVGSISDSELFDCYKKADIFCLSSISRNEAFGVVLLEAMSYSLPIICFKIEGSGVTSVVKNEFNAIVVSKINSLDLAKAINKLSSNHQLRELYSVNSRQRFIDNFTLEKMQNKVNNIYKNII